jgi:hypothetical protein
MRLGDSDSYVDIEVREIVGRTMPRSGDLRLRVSVRGAGFEGTQHDVWLRQAAAEKFVADLYAMAHGQIEEAALTTGTGRELTLCFSKPVRKHVLFEGKLRRIGPGSPATISAWVTFAVYVGESELGGLADTLSDAWITPSDSATAH